MLMNCCIKPFSQPLKARLEKAMFFLGHTQLELLTPGSVIEIDGEDVFAQVQEYDTMDAATLRYETHNVYYDVQYVVSGEEYFGCLPREVLRVEKEYDEKNDITFYAEPEYAARLLLRAGDYVTVSPQEAHKPRCAAGTPCKVKKIVVKVRA